MSIAELWIEFFEHYSLGIMSADNVISIRSTANLSKEDRQWKGKKMAIEDPFSTKRSLTRLVKKYGAFIVVAGLFFRGSCLGIKCFESCCLLKLG